MKRVTRVGLAAVVLGGFLTAGEALGQGAKPGARNAAADYPGRPVRLVVPFPPGASNDIIARLLGQKLTEAWGHQFVVDNRPGAGGLVGGETVARATPDGYTLLLANPGPNINNVLMRKKPPYHVEDFAPVVFIGYAPLIIIANPNFPPRNPKELLEYAKANPGKVSWGSSGIGSSLHIGFALFQGATGVNVVHVPYKGAVPAITDVVSGQIHLMYTTTVSGEAQIKAKRVKVIGVASAKRIALLPDVQTLAEGGIKDAEAIVWFGIAAPAKTPRATVNKLNAEVNKALTLPDVRARLIQLGLEVGGGTPAEFEAFMKREAARLRKLIQAGLIQQE
ncbi:MAG: tripartite tricarboxylate transporter substrate binding protein [Betaproteobacteria bacterium]|nr:tripartite tricarboxylate transporter substrate binding protein [Betaproteobacteria bacterium]